MFIDCDRSRFEHPPFRLAASLSGYSFFQMPNRDGKVKCIISSALQIDRASVGLIYLFDYPVFQIHLCLYDSGYFDRLVNSLSIKNDVSTCF